MDDKLVDLLLRKADQDIYLLEKLAQDELAPIEIFGFHAQQSAEKLLKASLRKSGIYFPRTHRIAELLDLLYDNAILVSTEFEELRVLTPYAVEFRYDVIPEQSKFCLDKQRFLALVRSLKEWCTKLQGL